MSRPTARVLTLLELLQSGGVRTVAELAGRLEVDERTVRRYVDHLLGALAFTAPPAGTVRQTAPPETGVLLALADAVRHHRPVSVRYTAADGRRSERTSTRTASWPTRAAGT